MQLDSGDEFGAWRALVQAELDKGRSITAIANDLGYARTSLSLVLAGKYIGSPKRICKKIVEVFGQVDCPYLEQVIRPEQCVGLSERDAPTHNPSEMKHWRACQRCSKRGMARRRIL